MKLLGIEEGSLPLLFFLCCQWLRGRLLLTAEFGCGSAELLIPAEPFFSLSVSWWKQSQTCRTCSQQKVFCCLPCPFTAFIVLGSLIWSRLLSNESGDLQQIGATSPLTVLLCWLKPLLLHRPLWSDLWMFWVGNCHLAGTVTSSFPS